ncbi:High-affinity branched-chain amino acid transport system permease protein LivH [Variovorax boronicumulans]|uniref:branched-chain amino acid ABC transporter permease n=1 Tax=Variovorax boronicumulans TaxID=436515 RepID=UPI000F9D366B|nr:branched-chain amino acid ABC transporter permease [Variovorax boronicumulans]PBI87755.1 High-affinity branched-chain amino acid transport system permease protein LivH [Variovorax boronicumulans]
MDTLLFLLSDGVINGAIYALLGLGIVLIYAVTRVINIAQGDFAMLGAMTLVSLESGRLPPTLGLLLAGGAAWALMDAWRLRRVPASALAGLLRLALLLTGAAMLTWLALRWQLPRIVLITLAIGLVAGLGVVFHRVAIEPIPGASVLVYIIVTLGTHMVIQGVALSFWGPEAFAVEPLARGEVQAGPMTLSLQSLLVVAATGALFLALFVGFACTLRGKALRASSVNRVGAQLCGIGVARAGRTAFFVATGLAAAAGILIAPVMGVHYEMGFLVGLKGFVGATLGGLISYPGAVVGGLIVGLLESVFSFSASAYRDALVFMMIVPILILRAAIQRRHGTGGSHDH